MASIEKRVRAGGRIVWRATYRAPSGAQRSKSFDRKLDAQRFLTGIETAKDTGTYVDPMRSKVAVDEWAWIWHQGQTQIKPTTRDRYAGIIRRISNRRGPVSRSGTSPTQRSRRGSQRSPSLSRRPRYARSTG